jgi:hypothetical protein
MRKKKYFSGEREEGRCGTQALNGWPGWRWKMSLWDRISSWGRRSRGGGRKEGRKGRGEGTRRKEKELQI